MTLHRLLPRSLLFLFSILLAASVQAQIPQHPDPVVNEALKKLEFIQYAYEKMASGDANTAQALMKDLNPIGAQLGAVTDKQHPAWTAAATKYNELNTGIPAKYRGEGQTADPAIAQIAASLNDYQKKLDAMAPGDTPTGIRYLDELKEVGARINAVTTKFHAGYSAIAKQYNELNQAMANKANQTPSSGSTATASQALPPGANPNAEPLLSYQQSTYNRLSRQVVGSIEAINAANDAEALQPDFKSRYLSGMQNYQAQVNKINRPDHPDVARLSIQVNSIANVIDQRIAKSGQAKQNLGNYEQILAEINERVRTEREPNSMSSPFVPEEVEDFIARSRKILQDGERDLKYLQSIQGSAFAPQNLSSQIYWQQDRARTVKANTDHTIANLNSTLSHTQSSMDFFKDPKNDHLLINDNGFAERGENIGQIDLDLAGAKLLYSYVGDQAGLAKTQAMQAELDQIKNDLDTRFAEALANVRMPKAASTDRDLLKAARETLTSGRYEDVNPFKAIVINSPLTHREMKEGDATGTSTGFNITVYHYIWDQFQVTTAEKVGDKYYLFYNTMKFYTSGGTTTPLNRWIVSGRFQGSQILEKNID